MRHRRVRPVRAAVVCLALAAPAEASIRYVTTTGSDAGNNCLSIVAPCRTITRALLMANPGDTINIGAGVFNEPSALEISTHVILSGAATSATVVRVTLDAVVFIAPFTNVVVRDLTIHGGQSTIQGGGIHNRGGLLLERVVIDGNEAQGGGGVYNYPGASLTMRHVTVSNNSAIIAGLTPRNGGGLLNAQGATAYIEDSVFSNNEAVHGGAISNSGDLSLNRVLLRENHAISGLGGALLTEDLGVARAWNSTFSGNSAAIMGGAILASGPTQLTHVTIANNSAPPDGGGGLAVFALGFIQLRNSIIGDNAGVQCKSDEEPGVAAHGSVSSDSSCVGAGSQGSVVADPMLGPLASNGGNSLTHALVVGSPAADRGWAKFCLFIDQRGYQRPFDGDGDGLARCDAGAFEYASTGPPPGGSGLWQAKVYDAPFVPNPNLRRRR